jgi:hypothetical protein
MSLYEDTCYMRDCDSTCEKCTNDSRIYRFLIKYYNEGITLTQYRTLSTETKMYMYREVNKMRVMSGMTGF